MAAPLRVPAARLRRVRDVLRVLQGRRCRTSPTSTSRRWSPGIDVLLFKPGRRAAPARAARDRRRASTPAFVEGARPSEIDAELAQSEAGRAWLEELERRQGPVVQHGDRGRPLPLLPQLVRRPEHPVRLDRRPRQRTRRGPARSSARPKSSHASASGSRRSTRELLDDESAAAFEELLGLSRTVFPYVEEHKFYCDYWFLTRWCNKIREFGALLAEHGFLEDAEDVFQLSRHEVCDGAGRAAAALGHGRHAARPDVTGRRSSRGARSCSSDSPTGRRRRRSAPMPEAISDPVVDHALGRHDERVAGLGARRGGRRSSSRGAAASPGVVEGVARVVIDVDQIGRAPRRRGARLPASHRLRGRRSSAASSGRRHRHRRRHVARGDRLPRVRPARGRRHRPRDVADPAPASASASTARPALVTMLDATVSAATPVRSPALRRRRRAGSSAARARASAI